VEKAVRRAPRKGLLHLRLLLLQIFVAPDDADRVYFGGVRCFALRTAGRRGRGSTSGASTSTTTFSAFGPKDSRHVALGNDGGLNLSFDGGATWARIGNLPVGQFTTIAVDDAEPYNIVGGLQDNGTMRGPSNYVFGVFDRTRGGRSRGDGSMCQIDPKDRNVVYTAFQFGFASRQNLKNGERARVRPRPELNEPSSDTTGSHRSSSRRIPRDPLVRANRLFRSFDRGDTFTRSARTSRRTACRETSPSHGNLHLRIAEEVRRRLVGTDEGKVWLSKDGGPRGRTCEGPCEGPVGDARRGVRLRRGDGLHHPERIPERRVERRSGARRTGARRGRRWREGSRPNR